MPASFFVEIYSHQCDDFLRILEASVEGAGNLSIVEVAVDHLRDQLAVRDITLRYINTCFERVAEYTYIETNVCSCGLPYHLLMQRSEGGSITSIVISLTLARFLTTIAAAIPGACGSAGSGRTYKSNFEGMSVLNNLMKSERLTF
jgi:hypothetical protein